MIFILDTQMYPKIFYIERLLYVKNSSDIKAFGTHLRKIREGNELSQQQLADMADVAKITVQRIENAKFTVTLDVMVSIAKALNMPLKDLVNFKIGK
jgi:DNA-binding XRE family transcriptional regulator